MNFFMVEDFLDAAACADLCRVMETSPASVAKVMMENEGIVTVDQKLRSTRRVEVGDEVSTEFVASLDGIRARAGTHFGFELSATERPQFLVYREGDFFLRHLDRDARNDYGRAVSVIVFLNDDYTGGELMFYGGVGDKRLDLKLPPSRGLLVGFRSDWMHEVLPVTHGERFTVVSWFG